MSSIEELIRQFESLDGTRLQFNRDYVTHKFINDLLYIIRLQSAQINDLKWVTKKLQHEIENPEWINFQSKSIEERKRIIESGIRLNPDELRISKK